MKCGIRGFPPLANTQALKDTLADIYAGKLSVDEAPEALKKLKKKKPPYTSFLVWLGVVTISVAFAVDIVGTWKGLLWGGITAMATGLVFLAADRVSYVCGSQRARSTDLWPTGWQHPSA